MCDQYIAVFVLLLFPNLEIVVILDSNVVRGSGAKYITWNSKNGEEMPYKHYKVWLWYGYSSLFEISSESVTITLLQNRVVDNDGNYY